MNDSLHFNDKYKNFKKVTLETAVLKKSLTRKIRAEKVPSFF